MDNNSTITQPASASSFYGSQRQPRKRPDVKRRTPGSVGFGATWYGDSRNESPRRRLSVVSDFNNTSSANNRFFKRQHSPAHSHDRDFKSSNNSETLADGDRTPRVESTTRTWGEARRADLSVEKKLKSFSLETKTNTSPFSDNLPQRSGFRRVYGRQESAGHQESGLKPRELFSCDIENRNPETGNRCVTPVPKKKLVPLEETQNMMSDDDESNVPDNNMRDNRKSSESPIPLTNLKNSCYMNSVVQSLAVFPQFILSLQKFLNSEANSQPPEQPVTGSQSPKSSHSESPNTRFPIITSLVKLFLDYETERRRSGDDSKTPDMRHRLERLKQTVGRESKQFLTDNQQDAGEFFAYLMDAASDEMKKSGKENLIDEWFAVTAETRMKCRTCGHESDPVVTHNTSTFLAVPESTTNPDDDVYLERLFAATLVQREKREFKCPAEACDGTEVDCTSSVSKFPPILMIQVSRISLAGEKIETPVQVNPVLIVRTPNDPTDEDELTAMDDVVQYKLRSVICHIGPSITKGHYYSMTRNHVDDDWYDCDDHEIRRVHLNNVQIDSRVNGYCFFFQREE